MGNLETVLTAGDSSVLWTIVECDLVTVRHLKTIQRLADRPVQKRAESLRKTGYAGTLERLTGKQGNQDCLLPYGSGAWEAEVGLPGSENDCMIDRKKERGSLTRA